MMESCLAGKPERVGPVEVDDIRRDLLDEFAALPAQQDSLQSQSENLQVYLRVRPFTAAESDNGESQECVTIEGPDTVVLKAPRNCQSNRQNEKSLPQTAQRFTFTQVFGPEASQRKVFEGSVRGLVRDVLEGGNCLVFTYGVTNAGKTFTFLGPDHDSGLLPRSLSVIFNSIEGRLYTRTDLKPQRCRDFSRLTPDQQAAESSSKKNLLRLLKESDKSLTSGRSLFLEGSSLGTDSSLNSISEADSFCLDVDSNVRFSVWVSFCEIYNDNIHDLLEQVPIGNNKRTVLRLSQDVKGNSFIKDLRWVQVNSSEEAYRVMKIGKKNQSFSSTRLNQLSSRSHSIFSIRILRVDDVGVPRVLGISELALCDLAGSERCSRTHNTGERLKEAGNINSSLLTLGKCINAMRLNQHAKFQHHVPFRESKLTHFLQFFFCGAGRVSMVVNVNQNASCFDETLNVLKFSALAQKVVVLNSRPVVLDDAPHKSAMELSMIIDEADQRRKVSGRGRKSSLVAWETTLEDVLEDEDGEEWEEEEESVMEGTVLEAGGEEDEGQEEDRTMEEEESDREAALRLVLEAQIREEVSAEFMELFNRMEKDYSDRLEKEREILEERAEKRVEILKNLVSKTVDLSAVKADNSKEEQVALLEGIISSMTEDLEKIREDAQSVHRCLTEQAHTAELEALRLEKQQSHDKLQAAKESLEQQQQKLSELMEICQQKDDIIHKLQAAMDSTVEDATRDRALVESIRLELLELQQTCCCLRRTGGEEEEKEESRKRQREDLNDEERGGPAKKRVVLEEEIWRLQEENDKKEETILQLREREERRRGLEEELRRREEEVEQLKKEQVLLEQQVQKLTDLDECSNCESLSSSLESEQRETSRLMKENKALVNGIFQLQTEVTSLQKQLKEKTDVSDSLSEQLNTTETRLQDLQSQSEEKTKTINSLTEEVENLRQEVKEEARQSGGSSVFHAAMEQLRKESQAALQRSAQKSQLIQDLQREVSRLEETLTHSKNRCVELTEELSNQKAEFTHLRAGLESESGALRGRLEEMERSEEERRRDQERERQELHQVLAEKEKRLEEAHRQTETLKQELQRLNEELQREEEKENRAVTEERKVSVVEELKEELQKLQERRGRQQKEGGGGRSREFEAVKREVERLQRLKEEREINTQRRGGRVLPPEQDICVSPLRSNMADRKKTPKTSGRKRKSCEVEGLVFSENKRNKVRGNTRTNKQEKADGTLQKIGELIHSSPSILGSKAKTIMGLVSGHSVEKEAVTTATKPRRGRRKLYKTDTSSQLLDSPHTTTGGAEEEKESDHLIIKRQLRSKTCRK
ncbi:kinesin-like protein KIF20A isoform X3 [Toxotes jaculatrix]|nr:kinesin-like protein KIF20A isoform X3 [Toxotes jaculatrix]XP_040922510.1 kinesin-like protein KIF20A isoform X3 [Toxotes jaculatrix]XP_040922511.1 kinesin-like protein KIF20A isoform X3 [Toxotes jaculatrix]XP_040922512.1 kinesin-like protein KIF20A isoform X3 [Toxotes jaculatrix]XP_040922513.1 kinesin-like protein KIF20A isoform X3 [Toxotes jaculatrix]